MNTKTLLVLAFVCALLGVAYWLTPSRRPTPTLPVDEPFKRGAVLFPAFKKDDAKVVSIRKGDRAVKLEKTADNKWVMASHQNRKVNGDTVDDLLKSIGNAAVEERRPGSADKFDLDEANRTEIEVLGAENKSLAKVFVGKSPEWQKCFVRLPGREENLELNENFEYKAQVTTEKDVRTLSPEKWYDLKLLRINQDDVIDVAIKKGHDTWRIQKVVPGQGPVQPGKEPEKKQEKKEGEQKDEKKEEKTEEPKKEEPKKEEPKKEEPKKEEPKPVWWVTEPEGCEADESACSGIASSAAWLDAKGYADELKPEERGLDNPTAKTRLTLKDGATHTLIFGKVADDYVVMQMEGKPEIWKIEKYTYESFTKPLDKLKKEKPEEKKAEEKKGEPKSEEAKPAPQPEAEKAEEKKTGEQPAGEAKKEPAVPPIPDKVK